MLEFDGLHKSYDAVWDAFDVITAEDPAGHRAALFRDTGRHFYRIA